MSQLAMPGYSSILNQLIGTLQSPRVSGGGNPVAAGFAQMMNQANQANAARGQSILQLLGGQGQSQITDINRSLEGQKAEIDQDMMSRGLYNTTIGSNLKQEANTQANLNIAKVNEGSAMNIANMANSFTQRGPSMDQLAQIMMGGSHPAGGIVNGPRPFEFAPPMLS